LFLLPKILWKKLFSDTQHNLFTLQLKTANFEMAGGNNFAEIISCPQQQLTIAGKAIIVASHKSIIRANYADKFGR